MSKIKYSLVAAQDRCEWDRLVSHSPQGTLFSESCYLNLASLNHRCYIIKQGDHIKAGICLTMCAEEKISCLDDLIIYGGLLFHPEASKKPVRLRYEQFELTEFAINYLVNQFNVIELALSPQFEDMRPFLWHEYHNQKSESHFKLDLRYTSYVDISSLTNKDDENTAAFRRMETLRQRHVRSAKKQGAIVRHGSNSEYLVKFYDQLMHQQDQRVDESMLERIRKLLDGLIAANKCTIFEVFNACNELTYSIAYAWDSKRVYYLFGAGNPLISEPWQGTFAHWSAFLYSAKVLGLHEVDMEGINSPKRGWFKLGFGGDIKPYYQIHKSANNAVR